MRSIDSELLGRILQNVQSEQNNNTPSVEVIVSRAVTPITRKEYWQESIVSAGVTATSTSVAVRKSGKKITDVYVAYVSGGTMTIKKSAFVLPVSKMVWTTVETIPNVVSCAIEFDGDFRRIGKRIEYRTDDEPMVIYTTTSGALMAGILGETPETLANSGASNIDAVRGISSAYQDIDQGMVIFYIVSGTVYYRQYIGGVWEGQQTVSIAPANAVSIKAERLFDYRICLQVKDSAGALHEVFTKMEASGWNGNEFISLALSGQNNVIEITYSDFTAAENISVALSQNNKRLYALSPVMVYAENRDNGIGDYGRVVRLVFDENIFGEQDNIGRFSIHDSSSGQWAAQSIARVNSKTIDITFLDFNNAVNPVVVAYTPGTMTGDIENLAGDTIWFTAENLVPYEVDPPVPMSASNSDQKTIEIVFDKPISSPDWSLAKNGFTVTSYEYNRIPDGSLLPVTYVVTSAEQGATDSVIVKLTAAGRMKYPSDEVVVNYSKATGNLVGDLDAQVDNFEVGFIANVEYPVFNPNDVERISASVSQTVVNRLVTYISVKEEEYVSVELSQTNIVYHVNDIPT